MQDIFEKVLEESECLVFTWVHGSKISIHGSVALVTLCENVRSTEAPGVGVSCREREREHNIKYYVQLNQIQKLREKLYSKMEEPKQTMEEPKKTMEEPKQTMEEPKQTASFIIVAWWTQRMLPGECKEEVQYLVYQTLVPHVYPWVWSTLWCRLYLLACTQTMDETHPVNNLSSSYYMFIVNFKILPNILLIKQ